MTPQHDDHMLAWLVRDGALVAIAASFGAAIKWLWSAVIKHRETREDRLLAKESKIDQEKLKIDQEKARYVAELKEQIDALDKRLTERDADLVRQNFRVAALYRAFEIVATIVRTGDPNNPALLRAEQILDHAFSVETDTPGDMIAMLRTMEH